MTRRSGPYTSDAAFRQGLEDRLKARAADRGEDLSRLRRLVAFDRVLARLFAAGEAVPWLVKGGYSLEVRFRMRARTTRDLDLAVSQDRGPGDPAGVEAALQRALRKSLEDGFTVAVTPAQDLHGPPDRGHRFGLEVALAGRPFASFHLDVGLGDPEPEPPEWTLAEDLLSFAGIPAPRIALVPVAQQFAEKLHAYTRPRTTPNTRVKDLVDLILLLDAGLPSEERIVKAVRATFERYASHPLPADLPEPSAAWAQAYEALARSIGLAAATLPSAHAAVAGYWTNLMSRVPHPRK